MTWLKRHNLLGICVLVWALVVGFTGVMNELSKPLSAHWRRTDMSALLVGYQSQAVRQPRSSAQSAFDTVRRAASAQRRKPHLPEPLILQPAPLPDLDQRQYAADVPAVHRDIVRCADRPPQGTAQMPSSLHALQLVRPMHFGDTEACR